MENLEKLATARRILIVEHDAADAELCRHVLQKANHYLQIDMAASRDDYLARIRETTTRRAFRLSHARLVRSRRTSDASA